MSSCSYFKILKVDVSHCFPILRLSKTGPKIAFHPLIYSHFLTTLPKNGRYLHKNGENIQISWIFHGFPSFSPFQITILGPEKKKASRSSSALRRRRSDSKLLGKMLVFNCEKLILAVKNSGKMLKYDAFHCEKLKMFGFSNFAVNWISL